MKPLFLFLSVFAAIPSFGGQIPETKLPSYIKAVQEADVGNMRCTVGSFSDNFYQLGVDDELIVDSNATETLFNLLARAKNGESKGLTLTFTSEVSRDLRVQFVIAVSASDRTKIGKMKVLLQDFRTGNKGDLLNPEEKGGWFTVKSADCVPHQE